MKRKVGTALDSALYARAKALARRRGGTINAVIEDALEQFLATDAGRASVVAETKGMFRVRRDTVEAILAEDLYAAE